MRKHHWMQGVIAAAMAIIAGDEAWATQALPNLPAITISAPAAGVTRPVPGWLSFCDKLPEECSVDLGEPETVSLTRSVWQQILAVNARVNATVKPLTDEAHWGVLDQWDIPLDGYGDCEDYQLLKRKLLVDAGLPRRALRITVVIDHDGEGHAVLMVRTNRGDFILDNKTSAVRPWHRTGYVYVKREDQHGPGWTSLGGANAPVATANR